MQWLANGFCLNRITDTKDSWLAGPRRPALHLFIYRTRSSCIDQSVGLACQLESHPCCRSNRKYRQRFSAVEKKPVIKTGESFRNRSEECCVQRGGDAYRIEMG